MSAKEAPKRWRADSALALVALIWGATFVVVKQALSEISTVYFLALRFSLASACMALLFLPALRRMSAKDITGGLRSGALAGLFLWLGYILQTFGLKYTTAGNSGFLTGLYIVLVPVIGAVAYRRWPHVRELLAILMATAGMAAITLPAAAIGVTPRARWQMNVGDLLTLACAVAFAFHLLVVGYFSTRQRFEALALGQIACAALLSSASLLVEHPVVRWSAGLVAAIVLTAVFATALAFALQTWGQKYTTATRTALIFALEPVFALATAVLLGGERLRLAAVAGGALILGGILVVELKGNGK